MAIEQVAPESGVLREYTQGFGVGESSEACLFCNLMQAALLEQHQRVHNLREVYSVTAKLIGMVLNPLNALCEG